MEAAFKPEVNGELDTQNFLKFDEVFTQAYSFTFMLFLTVFFLPIIFAKLLFLLTW